MNSDILDLVRKHHPITTAALSEHLESLGYGGSKTLQAFREQISKAACYLRQKGDIDGYDVPQNGARPLRYWTIPEASHNETTQTAGPRVSDAASEVETDKAVLRQEASQESNRSEIPTACSPPRVRRIPTKTRAQKVEEKQITLKQAMDMRLDCGIEPPELEAFLMGILEGQAFFLESQ